MCSGTMFTTPSGFSPHLACAEPGEEEEAPQEGPGPGACLADGPPITSASLDTLIQNLVPTTDYYPEVMDHIHSTAHYKLPQKVHSISVYCGDEDTAS